VKRAAKDLPASGGERGVCDSLREGRALGGIGASRKRSLATKRGMFLCKRKKSIASVGVEACDGHCKKKVVGRGS